MDVTRRDLEEAFARYGQFKSFDYATGDPAAIVTYNDIEEAIKARAKLTGVTQIADGKKVRSESGQSDSSRRGKNRDSIFEQSTRCSSLLIQLVFVSIISIVLLLDDSSLFVRKTILRNVVHHRLHPKVDLEVFRPMNTKRKTTRKI